MKKYFLLIGLALLGVSILQAQHPAADFYRQYKREEGVRNFKIPGWLIWFGSGVAYDIVQDEDTKAVLRLARKVKKLRLMFAEDTNPISTTAVNHFVSESRRSGFADLIYFRDGQTTVNIMGKIKKDKFKDIVIMVQDEGEFVFFHMKSNIRMKHLSETINMFLNDFPLNKESRSEEKKKKQKEKKQKQSKEKPPQV